MSQFVITVPDERATFFEELLRNLSWAEVAPVKQMQVPTDGIGPYGRGAWKGQVWMADDFDAPLDDFKDYMP